MIDNSESIFHVFRHHIAGGPDYPISEHKEFSSRYVADYYIDHYAKPKAYYFTIARTMPTSGRFIVNCRAEIPEAIGYDLKRSARSYLLVFNAKKYVEVLKKI